MNKNGLDLQALKKYIKHFSLKPHSNWCWEDRLAATAAQVRTERRSNCQPAKKLRLLQLDMPTVHSKALFQDTAAQPSGYLTTNCTFLTTAAWRWSYLEWYNWSQSEPLWEAPLLCPGPFLSCLLPLWQTCRQTFGKTWISKYRHKTETKRKKAMSY